MQLYNVHFEFTDGTNEICEKIENISVMHGNSVRALSGDEILTFHFDARGTMRLFSSTYNHTVVLTDIRAIHIRKLD